MIIPIYINSRGQIIENHIVKIIIGDKIIGIISNKEINSTIDIKIDKIIHENYNVK